MSTLPALVLSERLTYTVKESEHYLVELVPMLFNVRLVLTPKDAPDGWDRGWCYFGRGEPSWLAAYLAALAFDPESDSEPAGYDKALQ